MVQKLRDEFGGVLLQPGDDGYDAARSARSTGGRH